MGTLPPATPPRPLYRLFDSRAVGIAAFLCCPLGGVILIAVNYVRLRKAGRAALAVILGLIATALSVLIKMNWTTAPGSLDRLEFDAFEILFLACMWISTWQAAKQAQCDAVEEHVARGGQLGSTAAALGVGIASFAAVLIMAGGVISAYQYRKVVTIGTRDQVVYSGLATRAAAIALGNALRSDQYFQDRGSSVLLNKGIGATTVSFVVQNGVWNQPGVLSSFEEIALELAPTVGGLPIQVRLVDSRLDLKMTSTVGEVHFDGSDGVYYEGSATRDEAQALGKWLKSMGFFQGKGANVFLTRHDDGTTVAFVVVGEPWNDPKRVSSFEAIVRDIAPTVGGLPIEMHLVNTQFQIKKDELVEDKASDAGAE
jgi:hypothetical protein